MQRELSRFVSRFKMRRDPWCRCESNGTRFIYMRYLSVDLIQIGTNLMDV